MSSIEEILNADDSDEEIDFSESVDLEHLLHSRDDYDENIESASEVRFSSMDESRSQVELAINDRNGDKLETEDIILHVNHVHSPGGSVQHVDSDEEDHNEDVRLIRLKQAEQRESRFLDSGQNGVISALQSKRTSEVLVNYSNVRCNELTMISNQLKRNSSYKQHGPGIATAMVASEGFIAVGTSKGLVILFDHEQEIRSVLGSNVTNSSRPTSAVTALDVTKSLGFNQSKSLEVFLVCGYATGEVALWDTSKGSLVKLITDLHSSPIAIASILESTSDGLTNIGGQGDETNLVGLPAGWHPSSASEQQMAGSVSSGSIRFGLATTITSVTNSSMQGTSMVVISTDCDGVMYKTRFSKTMWSSSFACESECLLDSSTGPLFGYAPLPPLLRSMQSNSSYFYKNKAHVDCKACCRYVAAHRTARLLAINVGPAQTWIVQTHPKIKIVYKWEGPRKLSSDAAGPEEHARSSVVAESNRCLDWMWVARRQDHGVIDQNPIFVPADQINRPDPKEGVDWIPTLARSWGETVELLNMLTVTVFAELGTVNTDAASSSKITESSTTQSFTSSFSFMSSGVSTSAPSSTKTFTQSSYQTKFSVVHRRNFVGQKILSLRWVSSTELVLLTTSDVIVTNQALEMTERFPLQPSLSIELNSHFTNAATIPLHSYVCGRKLFVSVSERLVSVQMQSCFELADSLVVKGQWLEALALVLENVRRSPNMLLLYGEEVGRYIVRYADLAVKHPGIGTLSAPTHGLTTVSAVHSAQSKNHFHLVSGVCIEYCIACSNLDLLFTHVYNIFKSVQRHYVFLEALEPFVLSQEITSLPPTLIAEFCESALRLNRLPSIERCVAYFEIAHLDMNFVTKFLFENRMYSSFLYVYAHGLDDFAGAFQIIFNFLIVARGEVDEGLEPRDDNADLTDVGYKLLLFLCFTFEGRIFPRGDAMADPHLEASWKLLQLIVSSELLPTPSIFSLLSESQLQTAARCLGPFPYLVKLCELDKYAMMYALRKGMHQVQERGSSSAPICAAINVSLPSTYESLLNFCVRLDKATPEQNMTTIFFDEFFDIIVSCRSNLSTAFLGQFVHFCSQNGQNRCEYERQLVTLTVNQPKEDTAACSALAALLVQHSFGIASLHASRGSISPEQFQRGVSFYIKAGTENVNMKSFAFEYINEALCGASMVANKAEYRSGLCVELLKNLVPLCYLDLPETRRLVQQYLSSQVRGIVENSSQDLKMQFALLNALVPNFVDSLPGDRGRELTVSFDEKTVVHYFNLLATYDSAKVLDFLKSFEFFYPLDDCLMICRQKGISEAVAFLMERSGEVLDAVLMLLKDFSMKLKQVRRDVDAQLRSEMAARSAATKANLRVPGTESEHYLVSQILAKQDLERADATKKLPAFKLLESLIVCVADLCNRSSQADQAGLWFIAFDHLLMERQTVRSGTMSSSGEIVVVLIGLMLQTLMGHVSGSTITPQDIIRRVTAQGNAAGIKLGEFKGMMLSMLSSNSQELFLNKLMTDIIRADLSSLHRQKLNVLRRYVYRSDGGKALPSSTSQMDFFPSPLLSPTEHNVFSAASTTETFIAACRSKLPSRRICDFHQLQTEATVSQTGSLSLILSTALPAQNLAGERGETRQPGRLDREPLYRANM